MSCYPGQMVGLYDPPQIEKEQCNAGIPCNFGICSECTNGIKSIRKEGELSEEKASSSSVIDMWND